MVLMDLPREAVAGMRSSTEPYAAPGPHRPRTLGTTWGVSETGAAGPTGNGYGDAAGHTVVAIAGPVDAGRVIETAVTTAAPNMRAFAAAAMELLGGRSPNPHRSSPRRRGPKLEPGSG